MIIIFNTCIYRRLDPPTEKFMLSPRLNIHTLLHTANYYNQQITTTSYNQSLLLHTTNYYYEVIQPITKNSIC